MAVQTTTGDKIERARELLLSNSREILDDMANHLQISQSALFMQYSTTDLGFEKLVRVDTETTHKKAQIKAFGHLQTTFGYSKEGDETSSL